MFLRRLFPDANERPQHPPRSRTPSPPPNRVKRIEMRDMPDSSTATTYMAATTTSSTSYSAAYQSGPDPERLRDRLSRVPPSDVNFKPALPMPEEGVMGFDQLRERNERLELTYEHSSTGTGFLPAPQMGYDSSGLPMARLPHAGIPSPPPTRPVSQNRAIENTPYNYDTNQEGGGISDSEAWSEESDGEGAASNYAPSRSSFYRQRPGVDPGSRAKSATGPGSIAARSVHSGRALAPARRFGTKPPSYKGTLSQRGATSVRVAPSNTGAAPSQKGVVTYRGSPSNRGGTGSVGSPSVISVGRSPKRRVLTIQVRHPDSPANSAPPGLSPNYALARRYTPSDPGHAYSDYGDRQLVRRDRRLQAALPTITEGEMADLRSKKDQSDAALYATLAELEKVRAELAKSKHRLRQEKRSSAREREFIGEDLSDTRDELAALREDFAELEVDAQKDQVTLSQLRSRLQKQANAFETLQKEVAEREEAVKSLEADAAEKEKMMGEINEAHEQLNSLQNELDTQREKLKVAEDPEHSNTVYGMQTSALIQVVASLQLQNKALTATNETVNSAKERLESQLAAQKETCAGHDEMLAKLEAASEGLKSNLTELEATAADSNAKLDAANESKSALESKLAAVEADLEAAKAELEASAAVAAAEKSAEDTVAELKVQLTELTAGMDASKAEVEDLRSQLDALNASSADKESVLVQDLEAVKATLSTTEAEKDDTQAKLGAATGEAEAMAAKAASLEENLAAAQDNIAQLTSAKDALDAQLAELTSVNGKLQEQVDKKTNAATEIVILTQAKESLELQVAETTAHNSRLEFEWLKATKDIERLQSELTAMTNHAAALKTEGVQFKVQIESLSDRLAKDKKKSKHHHHHHSKTTRHEQLIVVRNSKPDKGHM
ncbi:hypothetical protein BROUX41_000999 [Berkeleyomyces rouxiae]